MARPRKKGLDHFPFDVGFFEDDKIACIAGEFGIKGEITVIRLLCAVYRNGYYLEWTDAVRLKLLRTLPGVSAGLLDQIINSLLRWGFFSRNLAESANVLTSPGIQRRYFEATKFRKPQEGLPYLLIDPLKNYSPTRVSQGLTPVSQGLTPVSQGLTSVSQGLTSVSQKKTPVSQQEIPLKDKEISTDVDKGMTSPPSPTVLKIAGGNFNHLQRIDQNKRGEMLLSDTPWRQSICVMFHLKQEDIPPLIQNFILHCHARGKNHFDESDLKSHFTSWYQQKINREKNGKSSTDRFTGAGGPSHEQSGRNGFANEI